MKRFLLAGLFVLLSQNALALEVAGVPVEPVVNVENKALKLNGSGIRKKLFIKVYIGSLYAAKRLSTPAEVLKDAGDKLIRMQFLHSRVEKEKIVEAFVEGMTGNAPGVAQLPEARRFLAFFTNDFVKGDTVDLYLGAGGEVSVKHNGRMVGSVNSARLAGGILGVYFGDKPADEGLKKGMLGN